MGRLPSFLRELCFRMHDCFALHIYCRSDHVLGMASTIGIAKLLAPGFSMVLYTSSHFYNIDCNMAPLFVPAGKKPMDCMTQNRRVKDGSYGVEL